MPRQFLFILALLFSPSIPAHAQEAGSGFDLRATLSGVAVGSTDSTEAPRDGSPLIGGFRSVFYPTLKLDDHWSVSGALQFYSRPYFRESLQTQGYGLQGTVLNAHLDYSRVWNNGGVVVRAGQLSTAFGSFMLRYDDKDNPLVDMPLQYGYYYDPVGVGGLPGVQIDATWKNLDGRVQLTNSSPANPRRLWESDQYVNWAGGLGYEIRQGFRVGVSGYRGPYLDRHYAYFFPGEANPRSLPGTGLGADAEWGYGHWNVRGEWQKYVMTYRAIPTFREHTGYAEIQRELNPRWYIAARLSYLSNAYSSEKSAEAAVGFRPSARSIVKVDYETRRYPHETDRELSIQFVTTIHPLSLAWVN